MDNLTVSLKRRKIEDGILARYDKVNFNQRDDAWLEDKVFWDYVFSWYELAHHYDGTTDTGIGAHMLELYARCVERFRAAAANPKLRERRRDKAADALYQINYYVNQMMIAIDRNSRADSGESGGGDGGIPVPI